MPTKRSLHHMTAVTALALLALSSAPAAAKAPFEHSPDAAALRLQSVAVKGVFFCGDRSASNVSVKLWNVGSGPDDLLAEGYTDAQGSFLLEGNADDLTSIDPALYAYHDCNDSNTGRRKLKFKLPNEYVTNDQATARRVFDIGTFNLETIVAAEERDQTRLARP